MHMLIHILMHILSTGLSTVYAHPWHGICYARMHPGAGRGANPNPGANPDPVALVGDFYKGFP